MKKIILFFCAAIPALTYGQVQFTMVNPGTQTLTITNYGSLLDITNYRLCSLFDYSAGLTDGNITIQSGNLNLNTGESVTLTWNAPANGFDPAAADMGLYLPTGAFNNPANMVCFMEYGAGMLGREPEAISAGLWAFNTFITGDAPFTYIGNGTESGVEFWTSFVQPTTNLVINEVDSDTPSADMMEFVELYGEPNESLDGLVVVFYNGSNDFSYEAFDLDGFSCDANGFFVLGNALVPNVDLVFDNNLLQNGPDAVAVYYGSATDFPTNTPVTTSNLVDAVVYDTSDPDDPGLLVLITSGGQINEDTSGLGTSQSVSRVPNGGEQLNSTTFVAQTPTPGESNILTLCDGGFVLTEDGSGQETVCIDGLEDVIVFAHMTSQPESTYEYVITNTADDIVLYPVGDSHDFNADAPGTYRVYGISYYGTIDGSTAEVGDPISGMLTDGSCIDVSSTFINVIVQACNIGDGCEQLFFSEYLEGVGNNKALEIVNPTNLPVDLTDYFINTYSNGSTSPSNIFGLTGTLAPGDVVVISNSSASPELQAIANALSNVTLFNGNDAIELRFMGEPIDVIGVVGEDPGISWPVGSGSTKDHDLVRKVNVTAPTTDWVLSSSQWVVYEPQDYSHLGSHSFISCSNSLPVLSFAAVNYPVNESIGSVQVFINVFNPIYEVQVDVNVTGGTAIEGADYSDNLPTTLTFPAGSTTPQMVTIDIIDDTEEETAIENIQLTLSGDENLVEFINVQTQVFILPNDYAYPLYDIATIASTNGAGLADSLDVDCEVRGIVHGINFNAEGLWFTLIDPTDGILIYNTLEDFGYTVEEGDSVSVKGLVYQFMGQQQIIAHSVVFISSGNEVEVPTVVTQITEENESHMIHIDCVELTDPAEWNNTSAGFLVTVSDGDQNYGLFIDGDTDLYGTDAPDGHFSITGIGHQVDPTEPYTGGYQVYPRGAFDLTDFVIASFNEPIEIEFGDVDDVSINFVSTSTGATEWSWNFGDGTSDDVENPTHIYSHDFLASNSTVTITLVVTNGSCSDTYTTTINTTYVGVGEWAQAGFQLFPVPANGTINISSGNRMDEITIYDPMGRSVLNMLPQASGQLALDISQLNAGLYIMAVKSEGATALRKFEVR